jgi:uncharacterized protein YciI
MGRWVMKQTFVVLSVHGPERDTSRGVREQDYWDEHAAFIDGLYDSGFIRLGGPFPDDAGSMLIVEAESADEVRQIMAGDPWAHHGILLLDEVRRWEIFLDRDKG